MNAAPSWLGWHPDTSTPATPVSPTTPTGTERRMLTLTLDIGGTKIAAGLVDPTGVLVHTATRPTPKGQGAELVWSLVQQMIADAMQAAGGAIRAVGIGSAGPVDLATGTVSPINIPFCRGFPL